MQRLVTILLCAGSLVGCAHVRATQSWPDLARRLSTGARVAVTTADQVEVSGKVSAVGSDSVTLVVDGASRTFDAANVRQMRRDGDPLWNGFLIGAGVGVLGAALPDNRCTGQPPRCDDKQIPQRVAMFAIAAGAGLGIDALHRDRRPLYRSPGRMAIRFVPILSTQTKGVAIVIAAR